MIQLELEQVFHPGNQIIQIIKKGEKYFFPTDAKKCRIADQLKSTANVFVQECGDPMTF